MEDNNKPEGPTPCTAGCGFYGNKIYNNMCSKCFKELEKAQDKKEPLKEPTHIPVIKQESLIQKEPIVVVKETEENKQIQKNKGRCFQCRSKIPLAKQVTNKCRCDYIFCDSHRFPDKHTCQFDHARNDKDILAKNNPKINDKPRGGNSFQRIDSL